VDGGKGRQESSGEKECREWPQARVLLYLSDTPKELIAGQIQGHHRPWPVINDEHEGYRGKWTELSSDQLISNQIPQLALAHNPHAFFSWTMELADLH
jgi:hypothetical protein